MTRELRLALVTTRLSRADELTLQIIEAALGLTERQESPDAGRPWVSEHQAETIRAVTTRVQYMRDGGARDAAIRAGLISEGWPAAAVITALEAKA